MGGTVGRAMDPTSSDFMGGYGATVDPLNLGGRGGDARSAGLKNSGGKNGGPATPDFTGAAQEEARLSRNDVNGAFGGASWSQGPDGRWTLNTSMSPELQGASQNLMGQIQNAPDAGAARDSAIDAAYQMQTSRLDPRFEQERGALEARLANEGFTRGDAGWNQQMEQFGRSRDDAYQQALLGAQSGAGNTAYAQSLAAAMQPYQQLQAIQGMGEGMGRQALSGAQAPDLMAALSAQYGGDLQRYGIQQQQKNSKNGAVASAAPLLLASSDERLKTEIERLPVEAIPGVPFARWTWRDGSGASFGVIAQDVEKVRPDLVVEVDGFKRVAYGPLLRGE